MKCGAYMVNTAWARIERMPCFGAGRLIKYLLQIHRTIPLFYLKFIASIIFYTYILLLLGARRIPTPLVARFATWHNRVACAALAVSSRSAIRVHLRAQVSARLQAHPQFDERCVSISGWLGSRPFRANILIIAEKRSNEMRISRASTPLLFVLLLLLLLSVLFLGKQSFVEAFLLSCCSFVFIQLFRSAKIFNWNWSGILLSYTCLFFNFPYAAKPSAISSDQLNETHLGGYPENRDFHWGILSNSIYNYSIYYFLFIIS